MDEKPRNGHYGLTCSIEVTHIIETSVFTQKVGNGELLFLLSRVTLKRYQAGDSSKGLISGGNVKSVHCF